MVRKRSDKVLTFAFVTSPEQTIAMIIELAPHNDGAHPTKLAQLTGDASGFL